MPAGIPGEISRRDNVVCEPNLIGAASIPFGAAVKVTAGRIAAIASGNAASVIYGFLVRPYPTGGGGVEFGGGEAPANTMQDVMRSGYMTVKLALGTAVKGAAVYLRVTADSGKAVGDIETAADSSKTVVIPGCIFMGPGDAGGNVEISFNI
jgi:hypothetical protein